MPEITHERLWEFIKESGVPESEWTDWDVYRLYVKLGGNNHA